MKIGDQTSGNEKDVVQSKNVKLRRTHPIFRPHDSTRVLSPVPLAGTQVMATSTSFDSQHLLMRTDALTAAIVDRTLTHSTINKIDTMFNSILLNRTNHTSQPNAKSYTNKLSYAHSLRWEITEPPHHRRTISNKNRPNESCKLLVFHWFAIGSCSFISEQNESSVVDGCYCTIVPKQYVLNGWMKNVWCTTQMWINGAC